MSSQDTTPGALEMLEQWRKSAPQRAYRLEACLCSKTFAVVLYGNSKEDGFKTWSFYGDEMETAIRAALAKAKLK